MEFSTMGCRIHARHLTIKEPSPQCLSQSEAYLEADGFNRQVVVNEGHLISRGA